MRNVLTQKREEGFTLIELLIVILILAILAAIVVFAVGTTTQNAAISSCKSDAKNVETALEAYKASPGNLSAYPAPGAANPTLAGYYGPLSNWLRSTPGTTHYEVWFGSGAVGSPKGSVYISANGVTTDPGDVTSGAAKVETDFDATGFDPCTAYAS